ncbi:Ig-like domain-containing protein [Rhizobacter sp. SG703]|uniref:Ig-like domain-containing protein n=1 Tax=Rhizobacter sp. SG703 TaxID=2587140 RepID=UPI0014480C78|nr:Ig-like domain-containing protein [Rhizobacter sp. SG703]NKI94463.1 hypothetical protein [Rhizobacter sp. SG703]
MRRSALLSAASATLLTACGGGFYVEWSDGFDSDGPPSVQLVASSTSVQAGGSVQLSAAASDQSGIDEVRFYRLDGSRAVLLGGDSFPPYEWTLTGPTDGRSTVRVYARAVDNHGHAADSSVLSLDVTP